MNLRTCLYQDVPPVGEVTLLNKWDKIWQHDRRVNNLCCWSYCYDPPTGPHVVKTMMKSWKNRRDLTVSWKNKGERDRVDRSAKNKIHRRYMECQSFYNFRLLCSVAFVR